MGSRIGQHNYGGTTDFTRRAGIVKVFNHGASTLADAPQGAIKVVRKYFPTQNYYAGVGRDVANAVIDSLGGYRDPSLCIELYNEPNQGDIEQLCDMIGEAVPVIRAAGLRLAAFSWGTGQPEPEVWDYCAARQWMGMDPLKDCIALHEYSNDWNIDGWNMGRFQKLVDMYPEWYIAVTETGFDSGGGNTGGWKNHGTLDQLYDLLHRYDTLISDSANVIGATVFTAQPTPDWSNFEFDDPRQEFSINGDTPPVDDQKLQQLLDQNSYLADAIYDVTKLISTSVASDAVSQALLQDAKTKINALNPGKFKF